MTKLLTCPYCKSADVCVPAWVNINTLEYHMAHYKDDDRIWWCASCQRMGIYDEYNESLDKDKSLNNGYL